MTPERKNDALARLRRLVDDVPGSAERAADQARGLATATGRATLAARDVALAVAQREVSSIVRDVVTSEAVQDLLANYRLEVRASIGLRPLAAD